MSDITRRYHPWTISASLTMITQMILILTILHGDNDVASAANQTIYFVAKQYKTISLSYGEDICKRKGGTLLSLDYSLSDSFLQEFKQYVEVTNFTDISFSDNTFFMNTDCMPINGTQRVTEYTSVSLTRENINDQFKILFIYELSRAEEMLGLNSLTRITWNSKKKWFSWRRVTVGKIICQIVSLDGCSPNKTTKLYYTDKMTSDLTSKSTHPGLSTGDSEQSSWLPTTNIESTSQRTTDKVSTRWPTAASSHFWTQTNKVSQTATSAPDSNKDTKGMSSSVTNSTDTNSPSMPDTSSTESDKVTFTTVTSNTDQQTSPTGEQKKGEGGSPKRGDNWSKEQKARFTEELLAKLTIDNKKARANVRRYTSANDERLSAQTLGWVC